MATFVFGKLPLAHGTKLYALTTGNASFSGDSGQVSGNIAIFYASTLAGKSAMTLGQSAGTSLANGLVAGGRGYVSNPLDHIVHSIDLSLDIELTQLSFSNESNPTGLAATTNNLYVGCNGSSQITDVVLGSTPARDRVAKVLCSSGRYWPVGTYRATEAQTPLSKLVALGSEKALKDDSVSSVFFSWSKLPFQTRSRIGKASRHVWRGCPH